MTTIHAYTATQKTVDGPSSKVGTKEYLPIYSTSLHLSLPSHSVPSYLPTYLPTYLRTWVDTVCRQVGTGTVHTCRQIDRQIDRQTDTCRYRASDRVRKKINIYAEILGHIMRKKYVDYAEKMLVIVPFQCYVM